MRGFRAGLTALRARYGATEHERKLGEQVDAIIDLFRIAERFLLKETPLTHGELTDGQTYLRQTVEAIGHADQDVRVWSGTVTAAIEKFIKQLNAVETRAEMREELVTEQQIPLTQELQQVTAELARWTWRKLDPDNRIAPGIDGSVLVSPDGWDVHVSGTWTMQWGDKYGSYDRTLNETRYRGLSSSRS